MIGTSLILFAVAMVFMRNQVKPIRRLATAMQGLLDGEGERRGTRAYAQALIGYAEATTEEPGP